MASPSSWPLSVIAGRSVKGALAAIALTAWGGLPKEVIGQEACPDGCAENQLCTDRGCVTPCANHRDCRNKDDDPCVSNTCVDGFCASAIIECLPGSECYKGECYATTCELDTDCTVFDPCRWGRCGVDGHCEFTELDPCVICASDEECLGQWAEHGLLRQCLPAARAPSAP